jgi:gliding motility-associated-like protein
MWDFGDGGTAISKDVTHNYTEIGVYDVSLLVVSASGCRDSILLEDEVSIIGEGDIKFPNAFTPNGDGLNDSFKPVSKGVIKYEMYVYNRWGELIFTTKDLNAGWSGKINGDLAKPDVYVWKAEGKFTNGRSFELAGDITLIR